MKEELIKLFKDLFYEDGSLSLTRFIAFGGYLLFAIGSVFGNKFINSKYNSIDGGYEPKTPPNASAGK